MLTKHQSNIPWSCQKVVTSKLKYFHIFKYTMENRATELKYKALNIFSILMCGFAVLVIIGVFYDSGEPQTTSIPVHNIQNVTANTGNLEVSLQGVYQKYLGKGSNVLSISLQVQNNFNTEIILDAEHFKLYSGKHDSITVLKYESGNARELRLGIPFNQMCPDGPKETKPRYSKRDKDML